MAPRILLATTVKWPSAPRLAGAFAALGCRVEAMFPHGHALGLSRYLDRAHRYRPLAPLSSFAAALAAADPDLVVPCDDRALTHLLAISAETLSLAALLARSLGPLESYREAMERSRSMAIARAEGVLAPLTIPVGDEAGLAGALESIGFPLVLKAGGSWGGDGVVFAQTPEQAKRAFRRLAGPPSRLRSLARAVLRDDAHFLREAAAPKKATVHLQRAIAGLPATSAFACHDGQVLASLHMDVVLTKGSTGPACVIRRSDCARMDDAARRIARRFRFSGLIGLDFVRDREGAPHLIEINPRATQICHLALGEGHDLPAALLGLPARPLATERALIALFPQELNRDPSGSRLAGAYHDVPWDDPAVLGAVLGDRSLPANPVPCGVDGPRPSLRPRGSES